VRFDGFGQSDEARDVAVGPGGDIVVTGYCYSYDTNNDALTVGYSSGVTAAPGDEVPVIAGLTSAWPNPFNPRVTLAFSLLRDGPVHLAVHDLRGREVAVLASGQRPAGAHEAVWNGRDQAGRALPSGLYLAVLQTAEGVSNQKLVLTK
jgi:hypothetical protein